MAASSSSLGRVWWSVKRAPAGAAWLGPGGVATIEIGGADSGPAWLLVHIKFDQSCYAHPMLPLANACFPQVIWFQGAAGPFPINAQGFGTVNLPIPAGVPAVDIVLQGVTATAGTLKLSTPLTVEVNS